MTASALLDAAETTLLIVDMQTRLAASMPTEDWVHARDTASRLARGADELDLPVIVTRQYPKGLGDTVAEIGDHLPARAVTIDKTCFSSADAEEAREALAMTGRSQVVICGMEAHVCVLQTAIGLADAGYAPFVVADGVCSRSPHHRDNALSRLANGGITVTNHESCLFEWLRDARHDRFKAIAALLTP